MITRGGLKKEYLRNSHLKHPEKVGEPQCTRAQMIRYTDSQGRWVVEVFQYLRPDKTIGGSGKPDPKRLRHDQKIFIARPGLPS